GRGNQSLSTNATHVIARINDLERKLLDGKFVVVDDPGTPLEMDVNKLTSIPSTSNVASKKIVDECKTDIEDIHDETTQYIVSEGANDTSFLGDEDYDTHDVDGLTEIQLDFSKAFDINHLGQII
nr:hypothetical protein [Tanacetum cinerariifolium]